MIRAFALAVFAFAISACNNGGIADNHARKASFSQLRDKVLVPRCIHCHSEYKTEQGLAPDLIPGHPEQSPLYKTIASGEMPKQDSPLARPLVELVRNYIENAPPFKPDPEIELTHVTFKILDSVVFQPKCVKCHEKYRSEKGVLSDLEPGDPAHSILYNYVIAGKMPQGASPLSDNTIQAIHSFIQHLPARKYPPVAPTWSALRANLFERSCVACHGAGGSASDNPLVTYQDIRAIAPRILVRIKNTRAPMPAAHTTLPPTPRLIRAFGRWVEAGEPRN